jgi:hypothetical protein
VIGKEEAGKVKRKSCNKPGFGMTRIVEMQHRRVAPSSVMAQFEAPAYAKRQSNCLTRLAPALFMLVSSTGD